LSACGITVTLCELVVLEELRQHPVQEGALSEERDRLGDARHGDRECPQSAVPVERFWPKTRSL
jgi:hypothetical protein